MGEELLVTCPECESGNVYLSKKRGLHVCEDCEHEWENPEIPATPLRIFLSYGHDQNEELVRQIKDDLEARGHDVWFDKDEIKFGDEWRRSITDGISGSDRVLAFLSRHSTRKPGVCIDEIGIAVGVRGGNIQTILVEGEDEVQPPPSISHLQWLDMHEWKGLKGTDDWSRWYQQKLDEIVRVVESEESIRFAGEINQLQEYLKPVRSDTKMNELLRKPFVGREWMHQAVNEWADKRDDDSRLFWVLGAPGVGKSAFVTNLAHFGRDRVIALHFCEWNKQSHKDPRQVVLNIAFQLACRLPSYRKLLLTLPGINELHGKSENELFDYLLTGPLQQDIDGGRQRYLIILDALDEANVNGRNPVAELLAQNARRLPEWLGLLITSRPDEEVKTPLQGLAGLKPFVLDTGREENLADIRDYLRHQFPQADEATVDAIVEKSDGVFLYVEYVCDELRHSRLSLDKLDDFPHGLGGIYAQYFSRQFPDLEKYKKTTRHALGVLAAAREPLEPEFLAKVMEWDEYQLNDFVDSLGSLIKHAGGKLYPFHKSLFDWLTDKAQSGVYYVSRGGGGHRLADFGIEEYKKDVWGMTAYSMWYLPAHLVELERWDDLIGTSDKPGPLTSLSYLQFKCENRGVVWLQTDFNQALDALPEFAEERTARQVRDEAVAAFNTVLVPLY